MKKKLHIILKTASIGLFIAAVLFSAWSLTSLSMYGHAKCDNYLPPAGEFLPGADNYSFAIMSDTGYRDEPMEAVIKDIKTKNVNFIFHLGDIVRRLQSSHYESLLQDLHKLLGDTPFFVLPGNHDAIRSKQYILDYYKRAFGQPYYWFTYGDTLFIALNTAPGFMGDEQLKWLETVMAKLRSQYKNCIVCMHVPPEDPRPGKSYSMSDDIDPLKAILEKYHVNVIFSGHIHEYHQDKFAGAPMYIVPPSGQKMRGQTKQYGYLLCKVDGSTISVDKIDVTDKTGRDYFKYWLSTGLDGITAGLIASLIFISAFILLFCSFKVKND